MVIKSFEEVKSIIAKFPKASGVGYVVVGQLMKIASQLGLPGYGQANIVYLGGSVLSEQVFDEEHVPSGTPLQITWDGPSIVQQNDTYRIGIKETMNQIDLIIKQVKD